ncbi:hypothetical protein L2E82_31736 [Cichorium intybus]|uniref:Uncharacterized protein n=1 Tax=Cichorium intybus TaxID=13427 RepID=A0ACB9BFL5_CICIN|nr:hypothetical protein L2E82_31736 [Cichorium intybus]
MSSSKDATWHCEDEDCYICSDINPFPDVCPGQPGYSMNDPLPDKMPDFIFDAMTRAEEENKTDLKKTRILDDRIEVLFCSIVKISNGKNMRLLRLSYINTCVEYKQKPRKTVLCL